VRGILLQQPGVIDAGARWREGSGWVIYDPKQATADELAAALSPYYPAQVLEDQPYVSSQ